MSKSLFCDYCAGPSEWLLQHVILSFHGRSSEFALEGCDIPLRSLCCHAFTHKDRHIFASSGGKSAETKGSMLTLGKYCSEFNFGFTSVWPRGNGDVSEVPRFQIGAQQFHSSRDAVSGLSTRSPDKCNPRSSILISISLSSVLERHKRQNNNEAHERKST